MEQNEYNNLSLIIAGVASVTSIVSVLFAYYSVRIARNALKIAEKDFINKQSSFEFYLIENYRVSNRNENKEKFILYHIELTNLSDSKNSFEAKLELSYIKDDFKKNIVSLEHDFDYFTELSSNTFTGFPKKIRLEEKSTEIKWLIFKQPTNVFEGHRLDEIKLIIKDIKGNFRIYESYFLKDLIL